MNDWGSSDLTGGSNTQSSKAHHHRMGGIRNRIDAMVMAWFGSVAMGG